MAIRLAVGIPCHGMMHVETGLCLAAALKRTECEIFLTGQRGPYTHWNREALVKQAIEQETTHLLMVDTDMVFEPDAIIRLLALGKPIVGVLYSMRGDEKKSTAKIAHPTTGEFVDATVDRTRGPFKCAAVATGFMLIELEWLDMLERPLFYCEDGVGEDVYFCTKAREAGLEIWCDPSIPMGHIIDTVY